MNDIALKQRHVRALRYREGVRMRYQLPEDLDAASQKLEREGLGRLVLFDHFRAATLPESRLDIVAQLPAMQEQARHVQEMVGKLPSFFRSMLTEFDVSLRITKTPQDLNPDLANSKSVILGGDTYQNGSAGIYMKEARLAAIFGEAACRKDLNCRVQTFRVTGHEFGHAIDAYLGDASKKAAFLEAYQKDIAALMKAENKPLKSIAKKQKRAAVPKDVPVTYFNMETMRPQGAGGNCETLAEAARETFAELTADYLNKRMFKNDPDFKWVVPFSQYMPESTKYVEKLMTDLERYYIVAPKPLVPH